MTCAECNRPISANKCGCWPLARPTLRPSDAPVVRFVDGWLVVDWTLPLSEIRKTFWKVVLK